MLWESRLIPGVVGVAKVNRGGYGVSAQGSQAIAFSLYSLQSYPLSFRKLEHRAIEERFIFDKILSKSECVGAEHAL